LTYTGFDEIHIEFTATIRTSALSQFNLKGYRYEQIQKILKLKKKGLTDQQIADHFNSKNIKTPTGKNYTRQLVLITRYKYNKRLKRTKEHNVDVSPITLTYIFSYKIKK
jgi:hypothetical protein